MLNWKSAHLAIRFRHMKTRSCLTLLFLSLTSLLHAQAWTNMGIGGGGAQFAPSYSPLDPNLVFLQCDMGGIYRSTNNATNYNMVDFMQFSSQTDYPNGSCPIAYDPNNVNNLWAFGMQKDDTGGSLLKSTDEGVNWTYATQPPAGTWSRINQIVLDRGDSNFILLGTDTGAYRTTNGGGSWAVCPTVTGYVWGIVIDQSSAVGNRACYIGSSTGVFKSLNEGATWGAANIGLPNPRLTGFSGASTSAPATLVLYAVYDSTGGGTGNGSDLYRTINGAANWALAMAGPAGDGFNKVECAEGAPATAYALNNAQSATEGVWKTTDYGTTWNNVFTPVKGGGNVTLGWVDWDILFQEGAAWIQIKVDPTNPNRVAATDLDTSYQTTDGGTTWNQIYSTFADTNPIATGKKWATRNLEVTTAWHYYINPWTPTTHYICQSDIGLQRSTDSGATWYHSIAFANPWHNTCYDMAFDTTNHWIYAAASAEHDIPHSTQIGKAPGATTYGGVIKSVDDGVTWTTPTNNFLPTTIPATSILRDPATGNLFVAMWGNATAGTQGGVYKSIDGAANWTPMNTGLGNSPNFHAYQLKMDNSGNLYCLISGYLFGGVWTPGGIWKSTNGGTSWNSLTATGDGAGGPLYYLQGFDIDSSGTTIYAASMKWGSPTQKGMYLSTNGGTSWTHPITMFPGTANPIDGFCPSVNPMNASDVYLGTENEGLWESLDTGTSWSRITGVPFRNTHRVTFDIPNNTLYLTTFGSSVWKLALNSPTPTPTSSGATNTPSSTPTNSPTKTPTNTPTNSPSNSPTRTPTASPTVTPTSSPTLTVTPSASPTPTLTATRTFTLTPTFTATNSPTLSPTATATRTPTATPTLTPTQTLINSPTGTPTLTATNSASPTPTNTGTLAPTNTSTSTPTLTPTSTATITPTKTSTLTSTNTPTNTGTFTDTPTFILSATPTVSANATFTTTNTPTGTLTSSTQTPTITFTPIPPGKLTLFPNPADGTKPVTLQLDCSFSGNLKLQIFTTAFRKVQQKTYGQIMSYPVNGSCTGVNIVLDLKDDWGMPLANGLYYVVVSNSTTLMTGSPMGSGQAASPHRIVTKLLILR